MNLNIPKELNITNTWIIYTKSNCIYCYKVKELLKDEQIISIVNCDKWLQNNIKKEIFIKEMKNIIGHELKTFPMVFLNGQFIGGYVETKKYFDSNNNNIQINEDF
jgi:glutaredoxin